MKKFNTHVQIPDEPDMEVKWLLTIRIALLGIGLASVAFSTFINQISANYDAQFIYTMVAFLFAFSAISAIWLESRQVGVAFTYFQLLTDVCIITGVIYATGGPTSSFLFLYLPPVMLAGILMSRRTALIVSFFSAALYAILAFALLNQKLLPFTEDTIELASGVALLQVIGLLSAMILTAVITSALAKKLSSSYMLVEQSLRDLESLIQKQQTLIDGIPEGIIMTLTNGKITNVNVSAMNLLSLEEKDITGKTLDTVLLNWEKNLVPEETSRTRISTDELEIEYKDAGKFAHIIYHSRPVLDNEGTVTGTIYVFQDITRLRTIEAQLEMQERMTRLLAETEPQESIYEREFKGLTGDSPVMQKVFKLIERVAPSDTTVLVHGESGTGKELVARAIHTTGSRSSGAFIAVNCGAIPESLIESQLFGHKKGSFTGADSDRPGFFLEAHGGTIFLDEIGELPLHLQSKLLRVIQEKRIRAVGATGDRNIDLRIIAATNKNLGDEVRKGAFREDLFYRLNVIGIQLPPLRDRKEDIPLLVQNFLANLVTEDGKPAVAPEAMRLLMEYQYPGNVRELENIIERAFVLGGEIILPEHLPENVRDNSYRAEEGAVTEIVVDETAEFPVQLDEILQNLERQYLLYALDQTEGAKKKAAELLGINFRSFRYRLQKFGLTEE